MLFAKRISDTETDKLMARRKRSTSSSQVDELQTEVAELKAAVASLQEQQATGLRLRKVYRKTSTVRPFGLPLYSIAMGADAEKGERRGHAAGWIAIGDVATGVIAVGGIARGVIAVGGIAVGLFAVGGCSLGLFASMGGVAAGWYALGGVVGGVELSGGVKFPIIR